MAIGMVLGVSVNAAPVLSLVSREPKSKSACFYNVSFFSWLSFDPPDLVLTGAPDLRADSRFALVFRSRPTRWRPDASASPPAPALLSMLRFFRHETEVVACLHAACRATATTTPNPTDSGSGGDGGDKTTSLASSSSLRQRQQQQGQPGAGRLFDAAASSTGAASRGRAGGRQGVGGGGTGGGGTAEVRTSWCWLVSRLRDTVHPMPVRWGCLCGSQSIDQLFWACVIVSSPNGKYTCCCGLGTSLD